jgi:hypothetical protein
LDVVVGMWATSPGAEAGQVRVGGGTVAWPESPWPSVEQLIERRHGLMGLRGRRGGGATDSGAIWCQTLAHIGREDSHRITRNPLCHL